MRKQGCVRAPRFGLPNDFAREYHGSEVLMRNSPLFVVRLAFSAIAFALPLAAARADNQTVTELGDTGNPGQLRAKIDACQSSNGGTITFAVPGTIDLASTLPIITTPVTIDGGNRITINGNGTRAFRVDAPGNLSLLNLVVSGCQWNAGDGGALRNNGGSVTVTNCKFLNNSTVGNWSGTAIYSTGPLTLTESEFGNNSGAGGAVKPHTSGASATITNCYFHDNKANTDSGSPGAGGAMQIFDGATVTITACKFAQNSTTGIGGGIYMFANTSVTITDTTFQLNGAGSGAAIFNDGGTLGVVRTTLNDNSTPGNGGAILSRSSATTTLTNCTVTRNFSDTADSGIIFNDSSTLTLQSCTIAGNLGYGGSTGGGTAVVNSGGTIHIGNTVVARNAGPDSAPDVKGAFASDGFNFIGVGDGSTGFGTNLHDHIGTAASPKDPKLGVLKDNGGLTWTMIPLPDSPLVDQGKAFGFTTDQRGLRRPVNVPAIPNAFPGGADIGSTEIGRRFLVKNLADSGDGSLRGAIGNAASGDVINFKLPSPRTIALTSGELVINKDLIINGPGADKLTLKRVKTAPKFRIFNIGQDEVVSIDGLKIANGNTPDAGGAIDSVGIVQLSNMIFNANKAGNGGAIFNGGTLTVADCRFTRNSAAVAGAIQNMNTASLTHVEISGNSASAAAGGGIFNYFIPGNYGPSNSLTLTDVTLSNNVAPSGGGLLNSGGDVRMARVTFFKNNADNGGAFSHDRGIAQSGSAQMIDCTMSENSSSIHGGAIYVVNGDLSVARSTLNGNSAGDHGGAIYLDHLGGTPANITLTNVTVSGNSADTGGGIYNAAGTTLTATNVTLYGNAANTVGGLDNEGTANVKNTIFRNGTAGANCSGVAAVTGANMSDDGTCHFGGGRDNVKARLAPLADNGGPTFTHLPAANSFAINHGTASGAPRIDQRLRKRPQAGGFDIGAVERTRADRDVAPAETFDDD